MKVSQRIRSIFGARTLAGDMTVVLSLIVLVVALTVSVVMYFIEKDTFHKRLEHSLDNKLSIAAGLSAPALARDDIPEVRRILSLVIELEDTSCITVFDAEGKLLAVKMQDHEGHEEDRLERSRPVEYEDRVVGTVTMQAGQEHFKRHLQDILSAVLITAFAVAVLIMIVTGFISKRFINLPLQRLTERLSDFVQGRAEHPPPRPVHRELRGITERFEALFAKVKTANLELTNLNSRLVETESKYRSLVENSPLGIFRSLPEGRFLDANPSLARMLGYDSPDEFIRSINDIGSQLYVDPQKRAAFVDKIREQGIFFFENDYKHRDGGTVKCRVYIRLHKERRSGREILEGFVENMEEQLQMQEALTAGERRYRTLYEHASEAIFLLNREAKIIDANPAALNIFGFSIEEMGKLDVRSMLHPEDLEHTPYQFDEILKGLSFRRERRILTKGGTWRTFDLSAKLVDEDLVMAMAGDVTDRIRAAEEPAEARDRAEESDKAKSRFPANMSHEIRTPVAGIIGMAELALRTESKPEIKEYLRTLLTSAKSLLTLINDILDFSKIEAGKLELYSRDFDLREKLKAVLTPLQHQAQEKGITFKYTVSADVPEVLFGDPDRIGQILNNLAGNAVKFTDEGRVDVNVSLRSRDEEGCVVFFEVADTGPGIDAKDMQRIFDDFTQAEEGDEKRFGGTGLGLPIAQKPAALYLGRIRVRSEKGKGSVFEFTARFGYGRGTPEPNEGAEILQEPDLEDEQALQRIEGDRDFLNILRKRFVEDVIPEALENLRTGLAEDDLERAQDGAHSLKGSAAVVGAVRAAETARKLEEACRSSDMDAARFFLSDLEEQMERVVELLEV